MSGKTRDKAGPWLIFYARASWGAPFATQGKAVLRPYMFCAERHGDEADGGDALMGDGFHILWAKVRAIWAKSEMDDEFNEELGAHLDLLTAENEKAGMKPQEARRAAILRVGGRETLREENRDSRGLPFLEVLART